VSLNHQNPLRGPRYSSEAIAQFNVAATGEF
jgi:hypothetical protein